jgi:hypothetical protein
MTNQIQYAKYITTQELIDILNLSGIDIECAWRCNDERFQAYNIVGGNFYVRIKPQKWEFIGESTDDQTQS